jgi:DCN1-like protein 1/2
MLCLICPRSEPMAIDLLKKMDWQVDAAADRFFMSGGGPAVTVDAAKVEQLFQSYAAKDGGEQIEIAGIEQLCSDLGVDPTDPIMLLIAWQMGCATMCVFTRQEW